MTSAATWSGHYPHAQSPDQVAALIVPFLKENASA